MSFELIFDIKTMTRNQIEQHIKSVTDKQEYLRTERETAINSKNDKGLEKIKIQMIECLKFENALIQRLKHVH